ncbi:MAG: hypothetical protein HY699_15225 [Deltaproteobacteria bacterium]|nr:hypothetical protein [Deltaproteobacteria bacterium]
MGMYDTIRFHGDDAPWCAAGHVLRSLQTKDLECTMAEYVVHRARLYRPAERDDETVHLAEGDKLVLSARRIADPVALTAEVTAYAFCDQCQPVLYLRDRESLWGDYVDERRPWCEWRFVFVGGALERCDAVRVEPRVLVAEQLRKEGLEVLDDSDRLARLHFERIASRVR